MNTMVNICSKWAVNSIFLVLFEELLCATTWLNCPRAKSQGAKKEVCFARRILEFLFLFLKIELMLLHGDIFNATAPIRLRNL
jgi:hypothetical protein